MALAIRKAQLGLFAALFGLAAGATAADTDGHWVLAMSWSPQYCRDNPAWRELQCDEPHYFVPLYLRKDFPDGETRSCESRERLDRDTRHQLYPVIPNLLLVQRAWRDHGACSGFDRETYFAQVDLARRRVNIPHRWTELTEATRIDRVAFVQGFLKINRGLSPQGLRLLCRREALSEVHFCLDSAFEFRSCGSKMPDSCQDHFRVRHLRLRKR